MKYLHEYIINTIEDFITKEKEFTAYDVTSCLRKLDLTEDDVYDCDSIEIKSGDSYKYVLNIEHSRVRSLVHLYMNNMSKLTDLYVKKNNGSHILYTPLIVKSDNTINLDKNESMPNSDTQKSNKSTLLKLTPEELFLSRVSDILQNSVK